MRADTMRLLASKGLSIEDIIEVAACEERRKDPTGAERQARYRERRADVTRDVTRDTPSLEVSPQTPLPNPNPCLSPLNPPKSKKALVVQVPDWIPPEPWLAFVAHRKAMRGIPFTDAAAKGVIAKIDGLRGQGHCPAKLLNKAVMHGWRTVFEAEDTKGSAGKTETADDCESRANFFAGIGNEDEAQRLRAKAAKLRSGAGPPKSLANVAGEILRRAG